LSTIRGAIVVLSEERFQMNTDEVSVLTVEEAAEYLRIPKSSLYKLAQDGKVPCQKVGKHWRFHKDAIDSWLSNDSIATGLSGAT
jgi:excisionase family DNA binding protein